MPKLRLSAVALLIAFLTVGCHGTRSSNSSLVRIVVDPDIADNSVKITCEVSSTGKCHLAFTGDASPSTTEISTGSTQTIQHTNPGTLYCVEAHRARLSTCDKSALPSKHTTCQKRSSSTGHSV